MELVNECQLQILAERTLNFHGLISEMINRNGFSFCINHGRYSDNNTLGSVVALKDSLKDVYLQIVRTSRKRRNIDEAVANLEQSIMLVIDKVNQFPEIQRNLGILEELTVFLAEFPRKSNVNDQKKTYENGVSRFLISTTRFVFEYALIFASIYATVKFREIRRQRDYNDSMMSTDNAVLVTDSSIRLDVLRGRG